MSSRDVHWGVSLMMGVLLLVAIGLTVADVLLRAH